MAALVARWRALGPRGRLAAGTAAALAVFAIAFTLLLGRDTRTALFAVPLRAEQVSEVAERLAEWNVPYVPLADNVRVDAGRRNDLLLRLSLAGVPHAHLASSAEALAKAGPLTPQSVLEAQQRDGLAGDLAAGLRGLPGVADAQVIIAPARDASFADESAHDATASVRLTLRPGAALTHAQLDGVRQFVASGVPGLDAHRVAILDDRGSGLGDAAGAADGEAASLQSSLQSALDAAVGEGAAIVRVRVSYDPRVRALRSVVRRPLGSRPIGTTEQREHYASSAKNYDKTSSSVDAGSETQDERVDTPAGRLERISVAVALDASRSLDAESIRQLAIATLGLQQARGDAIAVERLAFPHAIARRADAASGALALASSVLPSLLIAAAMVAVVLWGVRPVAALGESALQRMALQRTSRTVASFAPSHVRGALANEPPHTAAAVISALPAATATAVLEMYSPEERAAIVRRMARPQAPVVPDHETVLRRA